MMLRLSLPLFILILTSACIEPPGAMPQNLVMDNCTSFFQDLDLDGFGGLARTDCTSITETDVFLGGDCDDNDKFTHPKSAPNETEADACFRDADLDGFGDLAPKEGVTPGTDCNDDPDKGGALQYPGKPYYPDCDQDGYYTWVDDEDVYTACELPLAKEVCSEEWVGLAADFELLTTSTLDVDSQEIDCNDYNMDIHPFAQETIGDEVDDDCDLQLTCYTDQDVDSYGNSGTPTELDVLYFLSCAQPSQHTSDNNLDCDDGNSQVHPDTVWFEDSDHDGYGTDISASSPQCDKPTVDFQNPVYLGNDCNDNDDTINPSALEIVGDAADNDCNGKLLCYLDDDDDSFGGSKTLSFDSLLVTSCDQPNASSVDTDCNDAEPAINPNTKWYLDADNDTFGYDLGISIVQCDDPSYTQGSYVINNTDCNDSDDAINPAALEYCDEVDNNCDQQIDEETAVDALEWFADDDADSYGDPNTSVRQCSSPIDFVDNNQDCNDSDCEENPMFVWFADNDSDGFGAPGSGNQCERITSTDVTNEDDCDDNDNSEFPGLEWYPDTDNDTYGSTTAVPNSCERADLSDVLAHTDCDDTNALIHPDIDETTIGVGDPVDDNCDNYLSCYTDNDEDGYGHSTLSFTDKIHCEFPTKKLSANQDDCNDANIHQHPVTIWGIDQDEDTFIANTQSVIVSCEDPTTANDNYVIWDSLSATDCNDYNNLINPGAIEITGDDTDEDCDAVYSCYEDNDLDDEGSSILIETSIGCYTWGASYNNDDCDDADPQIHSTAFEIPGDAIDQNCDSFEVCYTDGDGDGYGNAENFIELSLFHSCADAGNFVENYGDCDDTDQTINPANYSSIYIARDYECSLLGDSNPFDSNTRHLQFGEERSYFGYALAAAGDINGDGSQDLLVGAPHSTSATNGNEVGEVFLYTTFSVGDNNVNDATYGASARIVGSNSYEYFGAEVGSLQDWNSDGFSDFMVSSTGTITENGTDYFGGVYGFLGASTLTLLPSEKNDYQFSIVQSSSSETFGMDTLVTSIYDRNSSDLVIADIDQGSVYIVAHDPQLTGLNNISSLVTQTLFIEPTTSSQSSTKDDLRPNLLASLPLANGGNGLAIGDPLYADGNGKVDIYNSSLLSLTAHPLPNQSLYYSDTGPISVNGATPLFGAQIITGDLNGDHLVDLVVSAPGYNYGTLSSCGGVYIYYADDKGEFPAAPDDYFIGVDGEMIGSSLALTDLNSDNRLELAIASHSNNVVYIIPSESISSGLNILANMVNISTLFSHDSDESFGISMIATPNVVPDNDQMSELLIGAPFMDAEEATDDTYSSQQEGVIISINGAAIPYQNYNMP